jgi:hypothetical protein
MGLDAIEPTEPRYYTDWDQAKADAVAQARTAAPVEVVERLTPSATSSRAYARRSAASTPAS